MIFDTPENKKPEIPKSQLVCKNTITKINKKNSLQLHVKTFCNQKNKHDSKTVGQIFIFRVSSFGFMGFDCTNSSRNEGYWATFGCFIGVDVDKIVFMSSALSYFAAVFAMR